MTVCVFDIETIPDVENGRRLLGLDGLSDRDSARVMVQRQLQKTGGKSEFLPHHMHRVVAVSVLVQSHDEIRLWSVGTPQSPEADLVRRFFHGIEKFTPTLVSWNGGGFDLPVLHYRALIHGISAPTYWDNGDFDRESKFNNYINRFHWRHIDLMDVLSLYQLRAAAPLHEIATMLGFPGKLGMDGSLVWQCYQDGEVERIRNYCETDVLNTYLVYLRFERMRGKFNQEQYETRLQAVRKLLDAADKPHWQEFLHAWQNNESTAV